MISILPESNYAAVMAETVEPYLDSRRQEMDMPLSTGGTLHAEVYEQPDATRAVVILHGYTESAEKFREMTWYFLNEKFNVYAIDHRGHGKSVRKISDTSITHVDAFSDNLRDLEEFMSGVVLPRTEHLPRVLYAHSMGGAIGGMTLMNHPEYFARAVLTAPMIAPSSAPLPRWAGNLAAAFMCAIGKREDRAFIGKPFSPENEPFETSCATSRVRFDYYERKRIDNAHLQNCSPTYGWVQEAIGVTKVLLDPAKDKQITTPLLLCQASLDKTVCLPEQKQFVAQVPGAKLSVYPAKHEIYMSTNDVMEKYVPEVIEFLRGKRRRQRLCLWTPQGSSSLDPSARDSVGDFFMLCPRVYPGISPLRRRPEGFAIALWTASHPQLS